MGGEGKENAVKHLTNFSKEDHEILVRIVKECQRQDMEGRSGTWKQYLANHVDKRANPGPNDPTKRPWHVLAQFVEDLTAEEDIKMVERMRKWQLRKRKGEELEQTDPWPLSPEQELVLRTQRHPNYKLNYNFPSYGKDWVSSKRGPSSEASSPEALLGVDCEMCVCENQVRELVRVAVVDRHSTVLLNTLVRPSKAVLDYKTPITGVGPEDLQGVTFTQSDAQKAVRKLLTPGTILVGHGLHHDLRALKIDHPRVIDTSLVFQYEGLPSAIPALSDLCKAVLKEGFRETAPTHDSVEDALTPIKLALHEIEQGPVPPLKPPQQQVDRTELSKLFIHKVPRGATPADLAALFSSEWSPHVQMITWKSSSLGTTFAIFANPEHANLAFKALPGAQGTDSLGRAQKAVSLEVAGGAAGKRSATEVSVRKMGCHNGQLFGVDARKGAVFSLAKKEGEQPRGREAKRGAKRRSVVGPTGEDLIEGVGMGAESAKKGKTVGSGGGARAGEGGVQGEEGVDRGSQEAKRGREGEGAEWGPESKRWKKGDGDGSQKGKRKDKRGREGKGGDGGEGDKGGLDGGAMEVDAAGHERTPKKARRSGHGQEMEDRKGNGVEVASKRSPGEELGLGGMPSSGFAHGVLSGNGKGNEVPHGADGTLTPVRGGVKSPHNDPLSGKLSSGRSKSSKRAKSLQRKREGRGGWEEGPRQEVREVGQEGTRAYEQGGSSSPVEVEMLKKRLEERDAEVTALQRLVTELARRQTLH